MSSELAQKSVFKDEATQKALNTPLSDPTGVDGKDKEFLQLVSGLVGDGKIDLYKPETLINKEVYEGLSDELKGKTDLEAMNLLSALRELMDLHENGFTETYQAQNLVKRVRTTKERLEADNGDLFII